MDSRSEAAARGRAAYSAQRADRIQRYLDINGPYLTAAEAGRRLGVSTRVIVRYRRVLKDTGRLP